MENVDEFISEDKKTYFTSHCIVNIIVEFSLQYNIHGKFLISFLVTLYRRK